MAATPCTAIRAKDSSKSKSLPVTGGIRPFGLGLKTAYLSMGSLLSIQFTLNKDIVLCILQTQYSCWWKRRSTWPGKGGCLNLNILVGTVAILCKIPLFAQHPPQSVGWHVRVQNTLLAFVATTAQPIEKHATLVVPSDCHRQVARERALLLR